MRVLALVAVALAAIACDDLGIICTAQATAGLQVRVTNAQTGAAICDAVVTATDGQYSETLMVFGCRYYGAYERVGTYAVRAERSGFEPRTVTGVMVVMNSGPCHHVEPAQLEIKLDQNQ